MSKKYVIEMKSEYEDTIRGIMVLGARDSNLYMDALAVEDMEELNSDYINEHFEDLQDDAYNKGYAQCQDEYGDALKHAKDTAYKKGLHDGESKCRYCNEYQRGFEDGKAVNDKGCEGCKYSGTPQGDSPCYNCSNYYKNNWTAKVDKIEVWDEVEWTGDKYIVTYLNYDIDTSEITDYDLLGEDGSVADHVKKCAFVKTGRHFDIASILEDLRCGQ